MAASSGSAVMRLPDLAELSEWGDPCAATLQRALSGGLVRVLDALAVAQQTSGRYDPSRGLPAMERLQRDVQRLDELIFLLRRFRRTAAWVVTAPFIRRSVAELAQLVQVDVAALHACLALPPEEAHTLVANVADAFGLHQSQYVSLMADCGRMLAAVADEMASGVRHTNVAATDDDPAAARRAAIFGEAVSRRVSLTEQHPMYQQVLRSHRHPMLHQLAALVAPNEQLTEAQRELANDEFVDSIVQFLHLYQRLLARFAAYKADAVQHQRAARGSAALRRINEQLAKLPEACVITTGNAVDVLLSCEIVADAVGVVLKWSGADVPGSATAVRDANGNLLSVNYLHRHANPANNSVCHQHVVRHLMLLPRFVHECVVRLRDLHKGLLLLQLACEAVTSALAEVIDTHASTLFTLAQGVAGVLRDTRRLDDALRNNVTKLEAMATAPSGDPSPEAVARWWCNDAAGKMTSDGAAIDVAALGKHLHLLATTATTLRHEVSLCPQSIEFLTQAMRGLQEAVSSETARTQQTLANTANSLQSLQSTADASVEYERGRAYITAELLLEGIKATMLKVGGASALATAAEHSTPTRRLQHDSALVCLDAPLHPSDRHVVGNMLLALCKEYVFAEARVTQVAKQFVASDDPLLRECEQAISALCTAAELLGQALYLTPDDLRRIGIESGAVPPTD